MRRTWAAAVGTLGLAAAAAVASSPATASPPGHDAAPAAGARSGSTVGARPSGVAPTGGPLDLGPAGLPETRTVQQVEPGVTWTRITRGAPDASVPWVVEVSIPSGASSPDPDAPPRAIQDEASARAFADRLTAAGFPAQAQQVLQPAVADVPAGVLGWRVRLTTTFGSQAQATAEAARLKAAGFFGRAWYAGWDGTSTAKGPWTVNVVTIDPRTFRGTLAGTFGPTIEARETPTWLSRYEKAKVAINAGFFVLDPKAGAEGDPAGAGVYDGRLESEPVGTRPVLVLDPRARHTEVVRPTWKASVGLPSGRQVLDGLNRVPGLIRNCGGTADDQPTSLPLHDFTCTDADELVLFTPAYGASTPAGPGAEAVLDRSGRVVSVASTRGVALAGGQRSLQGTGARAALVAALRPGQRVGVQTGLTDGRRPLALPGTAVLNGGPELVRDGQVHVTQRQDGMVHPGEPSFAYGWVLQRNPRTFAGVDAAGRTLLVTVDGRQLGELGLSIPETAAVARSLGMVDAMNLDGGGSTAMVVRDELVSHPSDAAGERPVGDAIVVR
ncbi:phosphodiester glycosidase family protein [Phycicoccus sp. M110.8]|uniref:phosphodiester glycosidase family protein n=1 Tax=Phycicoccus sp. M110.8 TaxID=3075433 RepID=UPI0028FD2C7B|nr:phosphodiester glycosidase family protein [Phycicoccus sp. M110.8]MDU0314861.1 phosphodiester glycosidase family protein [Phycicoccus sp. M110.8]